MVQTESHVGPEDILDYGENFIPEEISYLGEALQTLSLSIPDRVSVSKGWSLTEMVLSTSEICFAACSPKCLIFSLKQFLMIWDNDMSSDLCHTIAKKQACNCL